MNYERQQILDKEAFLLWKNPHREDVGSSGKSVPKVAHHFLELQF